MRKRKLLLLIPLLSLVFIYLNNFWLLHVYSQHATLLGKWAKFWTFYEGKEKVYLFRNPKRFVSNCTFRSNYKHRKSSALNELTVNAVKPLFYPLEDFFTSKSESSRSMYESGAEKLILFYASFYRTTWADPSSWGTDGSFHFAESADFSCPVKCAYTDNRNYSKEATAILFPFIDAGTEVRKPNGTEYLKKLEDHPIDQIWIIMTMEPPSYNRGSNLGLLGSRFNMSATYRLDSDLYLPYGYFNKLEEPADPGNFTIPSVKILRQKKLAASLTSNCFSKSGREKVIEEMQKHIRVDTYGSCGSMQCPASNCREYLGSKYKFILAFENSLCQDYITEKFYEVYRVGAVPVTLGLGDYSEVAPPNSYINALDFPNAKALADYMQFLDGNDEEYLKYFQWKRNYGLVPRVPIMVSFCRLCMKVWERSTKGESHELKSFDAFYNHKMGLSSNAYKRNDTLAYKLLHGASSACVELDVLLMNNYFQ